jgi:hypothetical protein
VRLELFRIGRFHDTWNSTFVLPLFSSSSCYYLEFYRFLIDFYLNFVQIFLDNQLPYLPRHLTPRKQKKCLIFSTQLRSTVALSFFLSLSLSVFLFMSLSLSFCLSHTYTQTHTYIMQQHSHTVLMRVHPSAHNFIFKLFYLI